MFVSYLPGGPVLHTSPSQVQLRWDGSGEKVADFAMCLGLSSLGTAMWWSLVRALAFAAHCLSEYRMLC